MPYISPMELKKRNVLKKEARKLYKQGYSLRAIGKLINKSHEWVRQAIVDKKV